MQVQIADCLARIGGEAYERVLRDYLLYPDEHEDAKKQIMAVMSVNGMENPFMVYLGGKLVEARLDIPGKKKKK